MTKTLDDYLALFSTSTAAYAEETRILNGIIGQAEALQAPSIVADVIGGHDVADDHPEYWGWLIDQAEARA